MSDDLRLTLAERECLDHLARSANAFAELPELHPSDRPEFRRAIHAAQNIVLARVGLRAMAAALEVSGDAD